MQLLLLLPPLLQPPLPATAAPVATPVPSGGNEYQVQSGDTLYDIAARNGIDVQTLISANNLGANPASLSIGQALTIPHADSVVPTPTVVATAAPIPTVVATAAPDPTVVAPLSQPVATPVPGVANEYQVQSGDTLYDIAARNGIDVQTLISANNLGPNASGLQIGQVLTIPQVNSAASVPAATATAAPIPTVTSGATPGTVVTDEVAPVPPVAAGAAPIGDRTNGAGQVAALVGSDNNTKPGLVEYHIQDGDTLYVIAARNGIDVQTLIWANNLEANPASLQIGQTLTIPPVDGVVHVVKSGDTLLSIAGRYKIDGRCDPFLRR